MGGMTTVAAVDVSVGEGSSVSWVEVAGPGASPDTGVVVGVEATVEGDEGVVEVVDEGGVSGLVGGSGVVVGAGAGEAAVAGTAEEVGVGTIRAKAGTGVDGRPGSSSGLKGGRGAAIVGPGSGPRMS